MPRYELELDEDTRVALRRLAVATERSAAGVIRHLIRSEAARKGVWTPEQPRLVRDNARRKPVD